MHQSLPRKQILCQISLAPREMCSEKRKGCPDCSRTWSLENGNPNFSKILLCLEKLDGVGLVDNRPSTTKLHHFNPPLPPKKDYKN